MNRYLNRFSNDTLNSNRCQRFEFLSVGKECNSKNNVFYAKLKLNSLIKFFLLKI